MAPYSSHVPGSTFSGTRCTGCLSCLVLLASPVLPDCGPLGKVTATEHERAASPEARDSDPPIITQQPATTIPQQAFRAGPWEVESDDGEKGDLSIQDMLQGNFRQLRETSSSSSLLPIEQRSTHTAEFPIDKLGAAGLLSPVTGGQEPLGQWLRAQIPRLVIVQELGIMGKKRTGKQGHEPRLS